MENSSKFSYNHFKCDNCNKSFESPEHCGKPMLVSDQSWICWKGDHPPCCGRPAIESFDPCCDNPSLIPTNNDVVELI